MTLLIAAVGIGALVALLMLVVRRIQLGRWDLRDAPIAPSAVGAYVTLAVLAVLPAIVVSLYMYEADPCAPEQQAANVTFLWAGVVAGVLLCLAGLWGARAIYEGSRSG